MSDEALENTDRRMRRAVYDLTRQVFPRLEDLGSSQHYFGERICVVVDDYERGPGLEIQIDTTEIRGTVDEGVTLTVDVMVGDHVRDTLELDLDADDTPARLETALREAVEANPARDRFGRNWPDVPKTERCPECGQPDSTGDCSCECLSYEDVITLGGIPAPWESDTQDNR